MEKQVIEKIFRMKGIPPKEGQGYLDRFKSSPPMEFAVIKISGDCLIHEQSKKEIVEDIWFLSSLGLYPLVMHGAGKLIDRVMQKNGLNVKKINGLRKTDEKTLKIVMEVSAQINSEFVEALKNGTEIAKGLAGKKIFDAKPLDKKTYGFVGEVKNVHLTEIENAISEKRVPIMTFIGYDDLQPYNINADGAANYLVEAVNPHKFIILTEVGGVLDKNQKIISELDLEGMNQMINSGEATDGMKVKLEQIAELLEKMPSDFTVQITSSKNLLKELFTSKGHGTFISKKL
ncbi:MAG: acetylglutamate kinase [Candidatus Diapherotrites archaeon]